MRPLCVIGWRPAGRTPLYFRGDNRYKIYLPFISDELIYRKEREGQQVSGWVTDVGFARVFEVPVTLEEKSFAKNFIMDRFVIYPYDGEILPFQIFRPIKRPRH